MMLCNVCFVDLGRAAWPGRFLCDQHERLVSPFLATAYAEALAAALAAKRKRRDEPMPGPELERLVDAWRAASADAKRNHGR